MYSLINKLKHSIGTSKIATFIKNPKCSYLCGSLSGFIRNTFRFALTSQTIEAAILQIPTLRLKRKKKKIHPSISLWLWNGTLWGTKNFVGDETYLSFHGHEDVESNRVNAVTFMPFLKTKESKWECTGLFKFGRNF